MAVEKVFRCDLGGEVMRKDSVKVIRVGTLEDRPDAGERIDVCPDCESRPIADLIAKYSELRHGS